MAINTKRLIENVRMHLPGALDSVINTETFNTLDQFFRATNAYRADLPITTVAGTVDYDITPPGGSLPVRLLSVVDSGGYPVAATMPVIGTVTLRTAPTQAGVLTATVALSVDEPDTSTDAPPFPAWVLNQYLEGLVHGVLARMMAQPAKPYTNASIASYHLREFNKAAAQAKSDIIRQNTSNVQAWRYPQSFARRRP